MFLPLSNTIITMGFFDSEYQCEQTFSFEHLEFEPVNENEPLYDQHYSPFAPTADGPDAQDDESQTMTPELHFSDSDDDSDAGTVE